MKEFHIDHHQECYCQILELMKKDHLNIQALIIVYLYISKTASHTEKNYIALMTCATTRIIHLELMRDLSATSLIRCLKSFFGGRGLPKLMLSDSGKTFKADQLKVFKARIRIIWRFNLAKTPWWSGLFE